MLIRTDRLLLRPFEVTDVDDVWAFQRLPEVARHMLRAPRGRDEAETSVRGMMTERSAGDGGLTLAVILPATGTVIGEVSLALRGAACRGGEIGYVLHPDHHGRGLATEAANTMLRLGFGELDLHRITGKCSARNTASVRLLERLGMRREAHFLGSRWVKGGWRDEFIYAMLRDEWLTRSR
ncbi:GNAT family N-acetyltransferase [Actinophytocola sp.]|uniref:GNAT family N-acetyltransferase n=1 Tax=Actinophytocola sp. TaxID=1872138 RepID=UPI003D6C6262